MQQAKITAYSFKLKSVLRTAHEEWRNKATKQNPTDTEVAVLSGAADGSDGVDQPRPAAAPSQPDKVYQQQKRIREDGSEGSSSHVQKRTQSCKGEPTPDPPHNIQDVATDPACSDESLQYGRTFLEANYIKPGVTVVEHTDAVPASMEGLVKLVRLPGQWQFDLQDWMHVEDSFKEGTSQFGTIHPTLRDGGVLPELLDLLKSIMASAVGHDAKYIIARLQAAFRLMNLHSDSPGRAYDFNCVLRWATNGTGGSIDFRLDSDRNTVHRIHLSCPTMYIMTSQGGGIHAVDPTTNARWAHAVDTSDMRELDRLCALVLEYANVTDDLDTFAHKLAIKLSEPVTLRADKPTTTTHLTTAELSKMAALPSPWPPTKKTVTSQLLGRLGGTFGAVALHDAELLRVADGFVEAKTHSPEGTIATHGMPNAKAAAKAITLHDTELVQVAAAKVAAKTHTAEGTFATHGIPNANAGAKATALHDALATGTATHRRGPHTGEAYTLEDQKANNARGGRMERPGATGLWATAICQRSNTVQWGRLTSMNQLMCGQECCRVGVVRRRCGMFTARHDHWRGGSFAVHESKSAALEHAQELEECLS